MLDFNKNDLQKRLFQFAVNVISLIRKLSKGKEYDVINYQLTKSSTSSGANYEEAQSVVSRPNFSNKVGISLKEMREMSIPCDRYLTRKNKLRMNPIIGLG